MILVIICVCISSNDIDKNVFICISISDIDNFLYQQREFVKRSKHFPLGDHLINSHNSIF